MTFIAARADIARWKRRIYPIAALVFAIGLIYAKSTIEAHTRISQVTWTVDIAPIIQTRCARCHTAQGFGPMSLASYEEARTWSKAIRDEVLSGRMPPWKAAPGYGDFANNASLTPVEIDLLVSWADGGAPLGVSAAPAPVDRTLGVDRSDAQVFDLPRTTVRSGTTERFEIATGAPMDRWVTGWEFTPGNRSLVEEATLWIAPTTRVGSWTPLDSGVIFGVGSSERLARGSRLVVAIRYGRSSDPQVDQSRLTLYLGSKPRRQIHHRLLPCGTATIETAIDVVAIRPVASGAGEPVEVVARQPDESIEPVVVVPQFAPMYAMTYRLRRALHLARGTQLTVRSSSNVCSADLDFLSR
jgi:hypothetical protein